MDEVVELFYRASEGAERSAGGLRWGALMAAGRYGKGNGRRRGSVDSMEKPKVVTRRFDSTPSGCGRGMDSGARRGNAGRGGGGSGVVR
jgi:hypothetical protein